ncbi:MAG TPA: fumarylacetoacetate hydrolase family protein [Rhizomicrobium sp.]|jgi:2-keto-4-pentenoate hydratase|nr:fumarylacetoacetate hydrolase family protein [Rhizomicrobium sp.]
MSAAEQSSGSIARRLAEQLDAAWRAKKPIAPISESDGIADIPTAYAIQVRWTDIRLARGEKIAGRKIGLTSQAIRQQLNVSEPDYGTLWQSSFYEARDGRVTIPAGDFLQPRIEGEVAFLVRDRLTGPDVTPEAFLASVKAYGLGVEIVDSRIADWKIKLADTIADNASYGGFTVGPWDRALGGVDLSTLVMKIRHNGELAAEGPASAVMGHPAKSAAWLANKLHEFGVSLEPGDVIISGGITKMLPVRAGDEFVFSLTGQPDLAVTFS